MHHILRTTSNVDATPIQEVLDLIPGQPFGNQNKVSQDGLAIVIDCNSTQAFEVYVALVAKLAEYIFGTGDVPSYLTEGCENISASDASDIVLTLGASGTCWSSLSKFNDGYTPSDPEEADEVEPSINVPAEWVGGHP